MYRFNRIFVLWSHVFNGVLLTSLLQPDFILFEPIGSDAKGLSEPRYPKPLFCIILRFTKHGSKGIIHDALSSSLCVGIGTVSGSLVIGGARKNGNGGDM